MCGRMDGGAVGYVWGECGVHLGSFFGLPPHAIMLI